MTADMRFGLLAGATALMVGCVTPVPLQEHLAAGPTKDCAQFFVTLDDAVSQAGVRDGADARIAGFPYLRVDRFLSSWRTELSSSESFTAWVNRLQALDRRARRVELNNLSAEQAAAVRAYLPAGESVARAVDRCGDALRGVDMADPEFRALLKQRARVPDEYVTAWRVFGVYPLTAVFFLHGVTQYQNETHQTFARTLAELPRAGDLVRYATARAPRPMSTAEVSAVLRRSAANPLRIPDPTAAELEKLFAWFAPVWEVDTASSSDRIGTATWGDASAPVVDVTAPVVYQHVSHTRVNGYVLLQLNYIVWFPERPLTGVFDILGGHIDGINWRVTLAPNGRPLMYDGMHNCGCFHMFFPTTELRLKSLPSGIEPPLVPQSVPEGADGSRVVIRIAHQTHYIERVYAIDALGAHATLATADYDRLRSLSTSEGVNRSWFRPDGIVAGSDRAERWLFWPMGIPAPGAMRQWGHHATAFIGRRHFDDPDLFEKLFEIHPDAVAEIKR
jgi:hypothetical protein